MDTLLLTDELFDAHDPGPGHPERVERLEAIRHALAQLPTGARWGGARDATRVELERIHAPSYVEALARLERATAELDPDTFTAPGSYRAALRAAGAAVGLVDALLDGEADNGFALVRPPGHHAEPARAMGFCLFNNVAVAAAHAVHRGLERVAVVDWDVHHGNGTQRAFEDRRDVLFVSTHRFPFYPGTGAAEERGGGAGEGFTVNVPLPGGLGDGDYGAVFEALVLPVLEAYAPQLVLVSAGFDPHAADPLGGMRVSEEGFAAMCAALRDVAVAHRAPLGLVLEGGYDLGALGRSARACTEVLAGAKAPLRTGAGAAGRAALAHARDAAARQWRL
ncbi:MAG: histone deacetylase [Myxococcales bacterium]